MRRYMLLWQAQDGKVNGYYLTWMDAIHFAGLLKSKARQLVIMYNNQILFRSGTKDCCFNPEAGKGIQRCCVA